MLTANHSQIPEALFHAIATLVARFLFVAEKECLIAPFGLLTLWHIRHVGVVNDRDETVILRQELTRMLTEKFRYSPPQVTLMLDTLQADGYIYRATLTAQERIRMFGEKGPYQVVILKHEGKRKIEEFKNILRSRAEEWLTRTPGSRAALSIVLPMAVKFSQWLVKRYEPERQQILESLQDSAFTNIPTERNG